jgi:hypothetical protein
VDVFSAAIFVYRGHRIAKIIVYVHTFNWRINGLADGRINSLIRQSANSSILKKVSLRRFCVCWFRSFDRLHIA